MEKLIVEPKDAAQYETLTKYFRENGVGFRTEEAQEQERKREARKKIVDFINSVPKQDIDMEEITEWVEKVRTERYEAKQQNNS